MLPYAPWLCWIIPIFGAMVAPLVSAIRRRFSSYLAVLSIGMSALFSFSMVPDIYFGTVGATQPNLTIPWVSNSLIQIGVYVDPLSVLMASVITCIGFLVTVFSVAYMQEEPSLARFWFLIQLFIGGYLVIVMADNLLFMFIGWEIVGICCTGLAAFWYKDPNKAHAGLKTFILLRVADVLLLASILIIYATPPHTLNIMELAVDGNWMGELSRSGLLFVTVLMFFAGALGKGAQFPLHTWLPDALAASPSSFNALTECLAGPFIMARVLPIFHGSIEYSGMVNFFLVIAFAGSLTAVISASMATAQTNVFRVLSYSISSVIGYMMAAFGLAGLATDISGGYLAGTFLLTIDAFVSALLFLTATYISYVVGSDNLHHMSGFKDQIAHRSMEVGALAIAGIPPLSGFWCTNWIQTVALDFATEVGIKGQSTMMILGYVIFALLIVGGGITTFYGLRLFGLVLQSRSHDSEGKATVKAPSLMRISLAVTLGVTAFLDFLALLLIPGFNKFLQPLLPTLTFPSIIDVLGYIIPSISTVLTCVAVVIGGYPAYRMYIARRVDPAKLTEEHPFLKKIHTLFRNRYYINALYRIFAHAAITFSRKLYRMTESDVLDKLNYSVAGFFRRVSRVVYERFGLGGLDKLNYSVAGFFRRVSRVVYERFELGGVDAFNYSVANITASFCRYFRKTHSGVLSYNMLAASVGMVLLTILVFIFGGLIP